MFEKIKSLREEREEGFTLIELLVVILIIGILSAIAIPAFLNQRKSAVDSSVQSDVSNAAKQIETWITKQGSTSKPLPSLETLDIKKSDGVTLVATGSSTGYCVIGTNPGGDVSATDGYVWASNDGGMSTQGKDCEAGSLTGEDLEIPPTGGDSGSEATVGTHAVSSTGSLYAYNPENPTPGGDYTINGTGDSSTGVFTYTITFSEGFTGNGIFYVGQTTSMDFHPVYFNVTNGSGSGSSTLPLEGAGNFVVSGGTSEITTAGETYGF